MKLGILLDKYQICNDYEITKDLEFDTLALVAHDIDLSICTFIDNEKFIDNISHNVRMVITNKALKCQLQRFEFGVCIVNNPRNVFFKLHNALAKDCTEYVRKKYKTQIGKNCKIHETAIISENNVTIGNNVLIEEYVVIRENTTIGDNCIIRAGVKIGGSDFEFKRDGDEIFGVTHIGGVIMGNDVEVQYNTGINKALYPWDNTVIGDYSKIDMLVHIAHGVKIGHSNMIVANSGIGGRTEIGNNCWIGFASTIRNGIKIGNDARVNMGSVVTKNVNDGETVTGNFAIDHSKFMDNLKKMNEN